MRNFSLSTWNAIHASIMLVGFSLIVWTDYILILPGAAALSFLILFISQKRLSAHIPNIITAIRFVIITVAIALVLSLPLNLFFGLMLMAVLLDVLDGYVARRLDQTSELGFYFDMEVDAFFVLIMSLYFYQYQEIPWWILVPGMLRYVFKLVTTVFPKRTFVESKKPYASIIAGVYFVILLVSIVIPNNWAIPILGIGGLGIIGSFTISFIEYFRWNEK